MAERGKKIKSESDEQRPEIQRERIGRKKNRRLTLSEITE